jgi:hypothetical protein
MCACERFTFEELAEFVSAAKQLNPSWKYPPRGESTHPTLQNTRPQGRFPGDFMIYFGKPEDVKVRMTCERYEGEREKVLKFSSGHYITVQCKDDPSRFRIKIVIVSISMGTGESFFDLPEKWSRIFEWVYAESHFFPFRAKDYYERQFWT